MSESPRTCISSPPDREHLVAEIFFDEEQWAEINREDGVLHVEFYARRDGNPWRFELADAIAALEEGKRRL